MNISVRRASRLLVALLLVQVPLAAEEKPASETGSASVAKPAATEPASATNTPVRPLLLVRASETPLGENSVIAVSPSEARRELEGLRQGLIQDRLRDPLPKSVMEEGGLAKAVLKNPKPRRILGLFNPVAPEDSQSHFHRTHKVNTLRGTAPLPHNQQDPIWIEPVGIDFLNWGW